MTENQKEPTNIKSIYFTDIDLTIDLSTIVEIIWDLRGQSKPIIAMITLSSGDVIVLKHENVDILSVLLKQCNHEHAVLLAENEPSISIDMEVKSGDSEKYQELIKRFVSAYSTNTTHRASR